MNKQELVEKMAERVDGLTKTLAAQALEALIESIQEALANGDIVKLVGFGTFQAKQRKARMARNPQTGEEIPVPAKTVPTFSPGKILKSLLGG